MCHMDPSPSVGAVDGLSDLDVGPFCNPGTSCQVQSQSMYFCWNCWSLLVEQNLPPEIPEIRNCNCDMRLADSLLGFGRPRARRHTNVCYATDLHGTLLKGAFRKGPLRGERRRPKR